MRRSSGRAFSTGCATASSPGAAKTAMRAPGNGPSGAVSFSASSAKFSPGHVLPGQRAAGAIASTGIPSGMILAALANDASSNQKRGEGGGDALTTRATCSTLCMLLLWRLQIYLFLVCSTRDSGLLRISTTISHLCSVTARASNRQWPPKRSFFMEITLLTLGMAENIPVTTGPQATVTSASGCKRSKWSSAPVVRMASPRLVAEINSIFMLGVGENRFWLFFCFGSSSCFFCYYFVILRRRQETKTE